MGLMIEGMEAGETPAPAAGPETPGPAGPEPAPRPEAATADASAGVPAGEGSAGEADGGYDELAVEDGDTFEEVAVTDGRPAEAAGAEAESEPTAQVGGGEGSAESGQARRRKGRGEGPPLACGEHQERGEYRDKAEGYSSVTHDTIISDLRTRGIDVLPVACLPPAVTRCSETTYSESANSSAEISP